MAGEWTFPDTDYYEDLQKTIPGVRFTSGYRTPEYQEDMRRRGYKPAKNSGHLRGEKLDLLPPEGKSMDWLKQQIAEHYPEAFVNPNEGDHADVRFPGYTGAPALGGAKDAGITNPNRGWTFSGSVDEDGLTGSVTDESPVVDPEFYDKVSNGQSISSSDPLGFWDRLSQRAKEMAGLSGEGMNSAAARFLYENLTGMNDEQKEAFRQKVLSERQGQRQFWEDQDERSDSYITNFLADVLGGAAGDINPTMLIGPGGSVGARILGNAAVNAGLDAAVQGAEMGQGLQDEFDLKRSGMNALAGGAFQGGAEAIGAIARRLGKAVTRTEDGGVLVDNGDGTASQFDPEGNPVNEGLSGSVTDTGTWEDQFRTQTRTPEEEAAYQEVYNEFRDESPSSDEVFDDLVNNDRQIQAEMKYELARRGANQDIIYKKPYDPEGITDPDIGTDEQLFRYGTDESIPVRTYTDDEARQIIERRLGKSAEETPKEAISSRDRVTEQVNEITKDWKNAPEFRVVDDVNQLPENIREAIVNDGADDAMGFVGPDGKVYVMAHNLESPDEVPAVVFHEALGHNGLSNLFRDRIDDELIRLYRNNPQLRKDTDTWIKENGDPYQEHDNPLARSIEEVFAERSESGKLDINLYNRLKQAIKQFARKMKIKLDVTDAEVDRILALAHRSVTEGSNRAAPSGLRYIRKKTPANDNQSFEDVANKASYSNDPDVKRMADNYWNSKSLLDYSSDKNFSLKEAYNNLIRFDQFSARGDEVGELARGVVDNYEKAIKNVLDRKGASDLTPSKARIFLKEKGRSNQELRQMSAGDAMQQALNEGYTSSDNKYMRRRKDGSLHKQDVNTVTRRAEKNEQKTGKAGNLNLDRFTSTKNIKPLQAEIAKTFPKEKRSHEQTKLEAARRNISVDEVKQLREVLDNVEVDALATRNLAVTAGNRRANLARQIENGDNSERTLQQYTEALSREVGLLEDLSSITSSAGRLLNQYNILGRSNARAAQGMRFSFRKAGDALDWINADNVLTPSEKASAQQAVARLVDGNPLTKAQLKVLKKTLPNNVYKELLNPKSLTRRAWETAGDVLNVPRTIMSSMDLSAPLRQGIFLIHRPEYWTSFFKMFHYLGSKRAFDALDFDIRSRETFDLMEQAGLYIAGTGSEITKREEDFASNLVKKVPILGHGIRSSERAYVGFLNKLRADTFDSLVRDAQKAGIDVENNPEWLKGAAKFVNNATGRGSLGKFSQAGPIMSALMFSPRLATSRITMLNPVTYVTLPPVVRKEAIKSLLAFSGIAATILTLASLNGMSVETDPRSSDFAKIRVGNTRYDMLGGFQQYIVLGARLATNEKKSAKGEVRELGKKFGDPTRLGVVGNFFRSKASPVASYVYDYLDGKNMVGEPFDVKKSTAERFIPMFFQDVYDVYKDGGIEDTPKALPGIFGVGLSTYDENKPREKQEEGEWSFK